MLSNSGCYNAFASKLHMAEGVFTIFQPVVDADSNLCGVEVLARWNMPDGKSVISPIFSFLRWFMPGCPDL